MSDPIAHLREKIRDLQAHLEPLQQFENLSEMNQELPFGDALRLNTAIAYSLHSLYYTLLKLQGQNLNDHPVKKEIANVKAYVNKVQKALDSSDSSVRIDAVKPDNALGRQLKGSTPLPDSGHLGWKEEINKIRNKK